MVRLLFLLLIAANLFAEPLGDAQELFQDALKTSNGPRQVELLNGLLKLLPAEGDPSSEADLLRAVAFEGLEQPGWAAYYYARGGDLTGARRIQSERQVASVPLTPFALLGPLSKLFWVCAVILFFLALRPPPYRIAVLVAGSLLLLFGALVWIKYVRPAPAFVVEAVALRAAPNPDAPLVLDRPLFAAEGVSVLEVVEEGAWLKVRTAEGTIGFGPTANLRMLLIGG